MDGFGSINLGRHFYTHLQSGGGIEALETDLGEIAKFFNLNTVASSGYIKLNAGNRDYT